MTAIDIVPAVTLISLLIGVLAVYVARNAPFYGRLLAAEESAASRFHAIDGLRGFLAMAVVFHHVLISRQYYQTNVWGLTDSNLATFLGRGGVSLFFMITAFLFWNRVSNQARPFDARGFFISRLRRLVPMYLLAAILLIVTALTFTHFRVHSFATLLSQCVSWLLFTIPGNPDINGFDRTYVINGVFWTLTFEWKFYLLLPLLAVFSKGIKQLLLLAVVALYIAFLADPPLEWYFVGGAIAATIASNKQVATAMQHWLASVGSLVMIAAVVRFAPTCYSLTATALLFFPFLAIACGNSLFGLLTCKPARLLGTLSYSIYLLHSWILYMVSRFVNHFSDVAALSNLQYWLLSSVVAVATVLLSALTFRYIEFPFISTNSPKVLNPKPQNHRTASV
ncbi:MAG TPA: acyltransferase [Paraburkholderia sp.]|jgi:peptidoglycan/LPS O-acetylase OafA/YrhL|uniref:acyltransferase family protein n=1 Tax=Paraburkholderia sp. TaxID=1926495 RepID=UPI002DEB1145|nr:acyltransferase [Paraburkholderia sp.]